MARIPSAAVVHQISTCITQSFYDIQCIELSQTRAFTENTPFTYCSCHVHDESERLFFFWQSWKHRANLQCLHTGWRPGTNQVFRAWKPRCSGVELNHVWCHAIQSASSHWLAGGDDHHIGQIWVAKMHCLRQPKSFHGVVASGCTGLMKSKSWRRFDWSQSQEWNNRVAVSS
jgi:hypothetical protein